MFKIKRASELTYYNKIRKKSRLRKSVKETYSSIKWWGYKRTDCPKTARYFRMRGYKVKCTKLKFIGTSYYISID